MLSQVLEDWEIEEVRLDISEDLSLELNRPEDWKKYLWLQDAINDDGINVTLLDDERGQILDCNGCLFHNVEFCNELIEAIKNDYKVIFNS